jgi:hypothetical protein
MMIRANQERHDTAAIAAVSAALPAASIPALRTSLLGGLLLLISP